MQKKNELPFLLIIRGASAVGKSTVGKLLRAQLTHGFFIETDHIWNMLIPQRWHSTENLKTALLLSGDLTNTFLKKGYRLGIIDGIGIKSNLDLFLSAVNHPLNYGLITLVATDEILKSRMKGRKSGFLDFSYTQQINQCLQKETIEHDFQIDTTRLSPTEIVNRILAHFQFLA